MDNDVFFRLGSGQEYKFIDIELYDTSTNILYFKKPQDFFNKMYENTFAFLDNGVQIYQGSFSPGYSSSIPIGPFITSPSMYGNFALRIDNWFHPNNPDVRRDPKMIEILNQHNLLHSGLSISSSSVEITSAQLIFKFTVTNHDQTDLFILDPDKTGPNLFHFFTNGLYIYDLAHKEVFASTIQHQTPDPWNSWKIEWLSELKSGDSKEFSITYPLINTISPGEYDTRFEYPGLSHVTKDQFYQGNSRIWMGDISVNKRRTIQ